MRCLTCVTATVLLSIAISGCGTPGGNEPTPTAKKSVSAVKTPEPAVAVKPVASPTPIVPTTLIRPTDPEARLRAIKSGRPDPFAALVPPATKSTGNRPQPPATPPRTPTITKIPKQPSGVPPRPSLPPLPKPELAKQVQVLGIAFVNGTPQAIVKAPDESISRTVIPGDRLAKGQVLVKAIDVNRADPVVILEQVGVDVEVGIGRPAVELAAAAPTRALPSLSALRN